MDLSYGKLRETQLPAPPSWVCPQRGRASVSKQSWDPSQASLHPLPVIQSLTLGSAGSGRERDCGFKRARGFQML